MGDKAKIFAPLGNLFLNLIFTMLVPIVFFSIASAIANMDKSKRLGRIFIITLITFGITAIISGIIGVISFKMFNPAVGLDPSMFNNLMTTNSIDTPKSVGVLEKIVSSISVGDFSELLSRNNLFSTNIIFYINRFWNYDF